MPHTVNAIVTSVARRLRWTRTAEAFAVGLTGGLQFSAPLVLAWSLAGPYPTAAMALIFACALAATALLLPSRLLGLPNPARTLADRCELGLAERLSLSLCSTALAGVAFVGVFRLWFLHLPPAWLSVASGMSAALAAGLIVLRRGVTPRQAALYLDRRANLDERTVTALELADRQDEPLAPVVLQQAADLAVRERALELGYWRRTRRTVAWLSGSMVLCAGLALLPVLDVPGRAERLRTEAAMHQTADALAEQARALADAAKDRPSAALDRHAKQLSRLAESMRWGRVDPKQAMCELNRIHEEMRSSRARAEAREAAIRRLGTDEPFESMAKEGAVADLFRQAGETLAGRMRRGTLSENHTGDVSAALRAAAEAGENDPRLSAALEEAARAVENGQADQLAQAVEQASDALAQADAEGDGDALADAVDRIEQDKRELTDAVNPPGSLSAEALAEPLAQADRQAQPSPSEQGSSPGSSEGAEGASSPEAGAGEGQTGASRQSTSKGESGDASSTDAPAPGGAGLQDGTEASLAGGADGQRGRSTNRDQASGPGDQYEGEAFDEGAWQQVYSPHAVDSEGPRVRPDGRVDPMGPPSAAGEFLGPGGDGESYVSFEQAWTASRQRAAESVSRQKLPARLRKLIRDYYDVPD